MLPPPWISGYRLLEQLYFLIFKCLLCVCVCVCVCVFQQQVFGNNVVRTSVITLHSLISTLLSFTRDVQNRWISFHYNMILKLEIAELNNDLERNKLFPRAKFLYTETVTGDCN